MSAKSSRKSLSVASSRRSVKTEPRASASVNSKTSAGIASIPSGTSLGSGNECRVNPPLTVPRGTLVVIVLCVFVHLDLFDWALFKLNNSCAGLYQVFYLQEKLRILSCHFVHSSNWELGFQMISFLWKGHQVERCYGTKYFLLMILLFTPCCSVILLLINKVLADYYDAIFVTQCFYGFGSINFALKVIKLYESGDRDVQCVFGDYLCLKLKYFGWAEVVISHMVSTITTIAANAAGVMVGILYISGLFRLMLAWVCNLTEGKIKISLGRKESSTSHTSAMREQLSAKASLAISSIKSARSAGSITSAHSS